MYTASWKQHAYVFCILDRCRCTSTSTPRTTPSRLWSQWAASPVAMCGLMLGSPSQTLETQMLSSSKYTNHMCHVKGRTTRIGDGLTQVEKVDGEHMMKVDNDRTRFRRQCPYYELVNQQLDSQESLGAKLTIVVIGSVHMSCTCDGVSWACLLNLMQVMRQPQGGHHGPRAQPQRVSQVGLHAVSFFVAWSDGAQPQQTWSHRPNKPETRCPVARKIKTHMSPRALV